MDFRSLSFFAEIYWWPGDACAAPSSMGWNLEHQSTVYSVVWLNPCLQGIERCACVVVRRLNWRGNNIFCFIYNWQKDQRSHVFNMQYSLPRASLYQLYAVYTDPLLIIKSCKAKFLHVQNVFAQSSSRVNEHRKLDQFLHKTWNYLHTLLSQLSDNPSFRLYWWNYVFQLYFCGTDCKM